MTNLITEARELCADAQLEAALLELKTMSGWLNKVVYHKLGMRWSFDNNNLIHWIVVFMRLLPELCDALEKYRWIPVTEQLPTERGYYLAVVKRIAPDELGGNLTNVKIMRWMGEDWRYAFHFPKWINDEITETVTHWMPLPEPPEEGAEK